MIIYSSPEGIFYISGAAALEKRDFPVASYKLGPARMGLSMSLCKTLLVLYPLASALLIYDMFRPLSDGIALLLMIFFPVTALSYAGVSCTGGFEQASPRGWRFEPRRSMIATATAILAVLGFIGVAIDGFMRGMRTDPLHGLPLYGFVGGMGSLLIFLLYQSIKRFLLIIDTSRET